MCEKWTFFVLLDLIILACSTPGRFYHDYHTNHDKNPWNGEWSESWQYDWWQTTKLTRRRTTTPRVEPQSTAATSTTTLPQPTIRDVDIRFGETTTGNSPPDPKPITLIQELPTKDKPQTASNSSHSDAFQSALDNSETITSVQETSASKDNKKPASENNPNKFGSYEAADNPEKLVDQDSFVHEDTKTKPITNQGSGTFDIAISTIEADSSGAKPEISPQYKPVSEDSDDNKKYWSSIDQALEVIRGTGYPNENYKAPLLNEKASLWHVAIYEKKGRFEHICGGSLIKADLVISAGHCFVSPVRQAPPSLFRVAAGKLYPRYDDPRDTAAQYSEVRNISTSDMVAPCYQPDLAYVYLVTLIRYTSSVRPVCFSLDAGLGNRQLREGNSGTVASWSSQDDGACRPLRHSWLSLSFVENSVCQYSVNYKTGGSDRICAGEINNTTECPTDSGNGLVFYRDKTPYLRGVVSALPVHRDCARFYTRSFANVIDRRRILWKFLRGITEVYDLGQCEEMYRNPQDAGQNTGSRLGDGSAQTDPPTEPDEQVFTAQGIGSKLVPALPGTSAPALQWHVGVYSKRWQPYLQQCGGSLVKRDYVISAAHCFWDDEAGLLPASQFAVAGGKLFRPWNDTQDTYAQHSDISEIIVPSRFRGGATSFQDDIAVLRLSTPFTYAPGVQSVCVDLRGQFEMRQLQPGHMGTIMGWGLTTENGLPSQVLTYLELPVVDVDDCFADSEPGFHKYITSDKVCAGDTTTGKALCRGDSGGGFVLYSSATPYLHGVASTAAGNQNLCNAFALAALTSLYAHRAFLRQNIPDIDKECVKTVMDGITEREGTVTKGTEAPLYTNVPYFPYPNHFVCNCNCKP